MKFDTKPYEEKMKKTIEAYRENLSSIRAGRANPDVLKKITVDYYGSPTAISAIAEIKVTDARTIVITAWDKSAMKNIEKAIMTSDLGIHPQNDGTCIRLTFPPTTEERRRELCFEGHRWFDLRRWGMPEITHVWHESATESHVYRLTEKDLMYTIPIPDEAMQENSKLVQNELPDKRTYEKIDNN